MVLRTSVVLQRIYEKSSSFIEYFVSSAVWGPIWDDQSIYKKKERDMSDLSIRPMTVYEQPKLKHSVKMVPFCTALQQNDLLSQ